MCGWQFSSWENLPKMMIVIIKQDLKLLQIQIEYHGKNKRRAFIIQAVFAIFVDTPYQMVASKKAQSQK